MLSLENTFLKVESLYFSATQLFEDSSEKIIISKILFSEI